MKTNSAPWESAEFTGIPSVLTRVPAITRNNMDGLYAYIWRTPDNRLRVVGLIPQSEDGIVDLKDGDEWYFTHNLVGELFGPIHMPAPLPKLGANTY